MDEKAKRAVADAHEFMQFYKAGYWDAYNKHHPDPAKEFKLIHKEVFEAFMKRFGPKLEKEVKKVRKKKK